MDPWHVIALTIGAPPFAWKLRVLYRAWRGEAPDDPGPGGWRNLSGF